MHGDPPIKDWQDTFLRFETVVAKAFAIVGKENVISNKINPMKSTPVSLKMGIFCKIQMWNGGTEIFNSKINACYKLSNFVANTFTPQKRKNIHGGPLMAIYFRNSLILHKGSRAKADQRWAHV